MKTYTPNASPWSPQDESLLVRAYPVTPKADLMRTFPTRSYTAIRAKAEKLGVRSSVRFWSDQEITLLRQYYPQPISEQEIKKAIGRDWRSIQVKACTLGIQRDRFWMINLRRAPKRLGRWSPKSKNIWRDYYIQKMGKYCHISECTWDQTVELNHIDGNKYNWSESNVEILCPNHHSLTPTHAHQGNNGGKYR